MLPAMSAMPGRTTDQKRRSFLVLVVALVVAAAVVAFVLSRDDDDGPGATPSSPGGSGASDVVNLQTACGEIPPDQAFRVDALRRTADRVRADIAAMEAQGNAADAAQATTVAEALERLADAEESQQGVSRATRELGETLVAIC
jgi:hypothetical protein